jgi:predicted unusual protein kinase regulating ubiquinone biosynthesis (AarF/ABC1/UbiB family)
MARDGQDIPQGRVRRTAPVAAAVAGTAGESVVVALRRKVMGAEVTVDHERAAERYAELLGRSRGALMKAGQALSFVTMGPAAPPEMQAAYRNALARLREDAPPMAPAVALATLEAELGVTAESAFAEFEPDPIASASIGQVHRARLHDGRAVAVKIQYPGVAAAIDADLANYELLSTFIGLLMGLSPRRLGVDHREIAREISAQIREELDYRQEAANQTAFADAYRGHPFIRIPEVLPELSTSRVLTQEFVDGLGWDQALAAEQPLRERWAEAISRFGHWSLGYFRMANVDPHPGNFRFHTDGGVSFLDFGCVSRLSPKAALLADNLQRSAIRGDVDAVWRWAVQAGQWRPSDPVTPEEAYHYWRVPLEPYWGEQPYQLTHEKIGEWMEFRFSPTGPSANALKYIKAPPGFTILSRLDCGVMSLFADLKVALPWGAIAAEYHERAVPQTELGVLHAEFIARHSLAIRHA